MKTYVCERRVFKRSENKSYLKGEEVTLPDEIAKILLKKKIVSEVKNTSTSKKETKEVNK